MVDALPGEHHDQVDIGVQPAEVTLEELRVLLQEVHFGEDSVEGKSASVAKVRIVVMASDCFSAILLGKPTSGQSLASSLINSGCNLWLRLGD